MASGKTERCILVQMICIKVSRKNYRIKVINKKYRDISCKMVFAIKKSEDIDNYNAFVAIGAYKGSFTLCL